MTEVLCESCRFHDEIAVGCTALRDTDFGDRPCPFYRGVENDRFTGSDCAACFAKDNRGRCAALDKRPRDGCCAFFKTHEQYQRDLIHAEARINELEKANPHRFKKYYPVRRTDGDK